MSTVGSLTGLIQGRSCTKQAVKLYKTLSRLAHSCHSSAVAETLEHPAATAVSSSTMMQQALQQSQRAFVGRQCACHNMLARHASHPSRLMGKHNTQLDMADQLAAVGPRALSAHDNGSWLAQQHVPGACPWGSCSVISSRPHQQHRWHHHRVRHGPLTAASTVHAASLFDGRPQPQHNSHSTALGNSPDQLSSSCFHTSKRSSTSSSDSSSGSTTRPAAAISAAHGSSATALGMSSYEVAAEKMSDREILSTLAHLLWPKGELAYCTWCGEEAQRHPWYDNILGSSRISSLGLISWACGDTCDSE